MPLWSEEQSIHLYAGGLKTGPTFKRLDSVWQICVTNVQAGFIGICSISYTCSVLITDMKTLKFSSQICE